MSPRRSQKVSHHGARAYREPVRIAQAALVLDLSKRQVKRLKGGMLKEGTAFLAHKSRGKKPKHALSQQCRDEIISHVLNDYRDASCEQMAELLMQYQGISVSSHAPFAGCWSRPVSPTLTHTKLPGGGYSGPPFSPTVSLCLAGIATESFLLVPEYILEDAVFLLVLLQSNFQPDHPANGSGGETVPQRSICVLTGSRAEYGLLYWLMKEIDQDQNMALQIVATGAHLSPEFALSYQAIEADGFTIDEKVEILLSSDTATGMAKSLGLGVIGLADAFRRLRPDLLVLLGDRYDPGRRPGSSVRPDSGRPHLRWRKHRGGGRRGNQARRDQDVPLAFRRRRNLPQPRDPAGEDPRSVFNYGDPGLDNIRRLLLLGRQELEQRIGFRLGEQSS